MAEGAAGIFGGASAAETLPAVDLKSDATLNAGIAAHRADARKLKAFIRSFGTRGKTDQIDAGALTQYGKERADRLALWQKPRQSRQCLQSLVLTRADLSALSATKSKKTMGQFYQRLVVAGKKKNVALVVVMRKIVIIANARLRDAHINT